MKSKEIKEALAGYMEQKGKIIMCENELKNVHERMNEASGLRDDYESAITLLIGNDQAAIKLDNESYLLSNENDYLSIDKITIID